MKYRLTDLRETFCAVLREHAPWDGQQFLITHVEMGDDMIVHHCSVRFVGGTILYGVPAIECYYAEWYKEE